MESCLVLEDLEFYGKHGICSNEHIFHQRFLVSLQIFGDFSAAINSDSINDTADYSTIHDTIKDTIENNIFHLIEHLTHEIAQAIFEKFKIAKKIDIHLKKYPISWSNKKYGSIGFRTTYAR